MRASSIAHLKKKSNVEFHNVQNRNRTNTTAVRLRFNSIKVISCVLSQSHRSNRFRHYGWQRMVCFFFPFDYKFEWHWKANETICSSNDSTKRKRLRNKTQGEKKYEENGSPQQHLHNLHENLKFKKKSVDSKLEYANSTMIIIVVRNFRGNSTFFPSWRVCAHCTLKWPSWMNRDRYLQIANTINLTWYITTKLTHWRRVIDSEKWKTIIHTLHAFMMKNSGCYWNRQMNEIKTTFHNYPLVNEFQSSNTKFRIGFQSKHVPK